MSADRYEINDADHGAIRISHPSAHLPHEFVCIHPGADPWSAFSNGVIRQQARDLDQLRTDLAAAVSENAALLAANRDLKAHFDALKGDYDEAAHFARHFIRDDAAITPRGAIIRLGDKCTDLFVRLQQAEARLAAIDAQPTVVTVGHGDYLHRHTANVPIGTELIARPAKDQT